MRASGAIPAASACTTWARPISPPSFGRDEGVQRHVLALERGHAVAVLLGKTRQSRRGEQALPRVGHGPLQHQIQRHRAFLPAASPDGRPAALHFLPARPHSAMRYHPAPRPVVIRTAADGERRCSQQAAPRKPQRPTAKQQVIGLGRAHPEAQRPSAVLREPRALRADEGQRFLCRKSRIAPARRRRPLWASAEDTFHGGDRGRHAAAARPRRRSGRTPAGCPAMP